VGVPGIFPILVKETTITDTKTGEEGRGLDRNSYKESDRKAWEDLESE